MMVTLFQKWARGRKRIAQNTISRPTVPTLKGHQNSRKGLQMLAGLKGLRNICRQQADLLADVTYFTGKGDLPAYPFVQQPSRPGLREHLFQDAPSPFTYQQRNHCFATPMASIWYHLPEDIVVMNSVAIFKRNVEVTTFTVAH